jgi:S-DNA-T family DNA segregation ATPase FtsK/SpoIIIE
MLNSVAVKEKGEKLSAFRRVLESAFVILILFSVFLILSIFSHDSADPSWSQTATRTEVGNLMGYVGANVSDLLLFLFGYGAAFVPLTILYLGFCIFIKRFNIFDVDFFTVGLRIVGYFFLILSLLCLMSMNIVHGDFLSGGVIGNILSGFFITYLGELGTSLLFLAMLVCSIPLFTGVSLLALCDSVGEIFFALVFHRAYSERRKAERQLAANVESRRSFDDEENTDESGEPTVFDEETGFAIFLRDDSEIRYAGSSYDDDDYPQLKSDMSKSAQIYAHQPRNADLSTREKVKVSTDSVRETAEKDSLNIPATGLKQPASDLNSYERTEREPLRIDIPAAATDPGTSADNLVSVSEPSDDINPEILKSELWNITDEEQKTEPGASSDAVNSVSEEQKSEITDDGFGGSDIPLGDISRLKENSSDFAESDFEFRVEPSVPARAESRDFGVSGTRTEETTADEPVHIDFTSTSVGSFDRDMDETEDNTAVSGGSSGGSSYQTSNNIGAFAPEDPNAAIKEAEGLSLDDIPDFLPPGQKSVLDDEDYYLSPTPSSSLVSSTFYSQDNSVNSPAGSAGAAVGNSENSMLNQSDNREQQVNVDEYFKSLNEEITPSLLQTLRGRYNPHRLPSLELLDPVPPKPHSMSQGEIDDLSQLIVEKLKDYKITVEVTGAEIGPVITRFALKLSPGTKVSKISGIKNDLARDLAVRSVRVVDVIPGTTCVGIEIPNKKRQTVYFRELLDSDEFRSRSDKLTCGLGCSVVGTPVAMNLAKMPHLLVAGTTGSGKSVGVNGMILSMLYKSTPDDLRLILIDPKMLEFSSYSGIPHLLTPVVTDMKDATSAIRWCVGEMERRYKLMSKINVKNFDGYNEKVLKAIDSGNPILDPLWERTAQLSDKRPYLGKLPYIVLVIDELADMMMQIGKKVEELIARLAQKARAAGIHMIIATQSPRADVLTGLIKSNIPSRLSFTVANQMESRIILEQQGAESLLGNGDMLFNPTGANTLSRIHGAFVTPSEIDRIVDFWKAQGEPQYVDKILDDEITDENALPSEKPKLEEKAAAEGRDELFNDAVRVILETRRASTSVLQTRMGIGYPRASKLIYELEQAGIISQPMNQSGKRSILVDDSYFS